MHIEQIINKIVVINNTFYKIQHSNMEGLNYISIYNPASKCFLRHARGIIREDEYKEDIIFFNDSSFKPLVFNSSIRFFCINLNDQAIVLDGNVLKISNAYNNLISFFNFSDEFQLDNHNIQIESVSEINYENKLINNILILKNQKLKFLQD